MLTARGILTSRGGRSSQAALVSRQFGKPAVVGVLALEVDAERPQFTIGGRSQARARAAASSAASPRLRGASPIAVNPARCRWR